MTRRNIAGMAVAASVTVLVVGAVWRFGVVPVPTFPSLVGAPDPSVPGTVAFTHEIGGRQCAAVVAAGGGPVRDLTCRTDRSLRIEWRGEGALAVWTDSRAVTVYDPVTGQDVARESGRRTDDGYDAHYGYDAEHQDANPFPAVRAEGCWDDDTHVELVSQPEAGPDRKLVSLRAPRDYCFEEVVASPDRQWFVVVDSEGRLLLGRPDRSGLRQLASGAARYEPPAWSPGAPG